MAENKINTLTKTYDEYRADIKNILQTTYPDIANDVDDASIGSWLIDMVAGVGDQINYAIDRAINETNIDAAYEKKSILNIARTNGVKITGAKGAMCEVEFSCEIPSYSDNNAPNTSPVPNTDYMPIIKKGTKISAGNQVFEVMNDIDFSEQFDENGVSNRIITPKRNSNNLITQYIIKKTCVVVAGESKIYKRVIKNDDIIPFMEIVIPEKQIMNIESIIVKNGTNFQNDPTINEFMITNEEENINNVIIKRFFEVDSLSENSIWGEDGIEESSEGNNTINNIENQEVVDENGKIIGTLTNHQIVKGKWKPITQKFMTEYTNNEYLKVIFGSGIDANLDIDISDASNFAQYQMSKMIYNDNLGRLPLPNTTLYILYRVGGGKASNIAKGAINKITYLNMSICGINENDSSNAQIISQIKKSVSVTNTTPSISGKDMPSIDEIRYLIKYRNGAQNRCVTLKDYVARIQMLPSKYGTPYRIGVIEENNKIKIYILSIDYNGNLSNLLPEKLENNIKEYLKKYKMLNDFVEIQSGNIINLSFNVDIYINKTYTKGDVIKAVISEIEKYMSKENHQMGEDIYIGNLESKISQIDGVLNMIDLQVWNEYGNGYSSFKSTQSPYNSYGESCNITDNNSFEEGRFRIGLDDSDGILYSEKNAMFEIKYPEKDIKVRVKTR